MKSVWKCDINEKENFIEFKTINESKFDTVISNLTLEAACKTVENYSEGIRKLVSLLNPKGYLVMIGVLEQTSCRNLKLSNANVKFSEFLPKFSDPFVHRPLNYAPILVHSISYATPVHVLKWVRKHFLVIIRYIHGLRKRGFLIIFLASCKVCEWRSLAKLRERTGTLSFNQKGTFNPETERVKFF